MFNLGLESIIDTPLSLPADMYAWEKDVVYTLYTAQLKIEYLPGDIRRKVAADGTPYENLMPAAYGEILDTTDRMGDRLDFYLSSTFQPNAPVFIMDQITPQTKTFDEHKIFFGFQSIMDVLAVYDMVFSDGSGRTRIGAITQMSGETFAKWLADKHLALAPVSRQELPEYHITPMCPFVLPPLAAPPSVKPQTRVENGAVTILLPPAVDGLRIISRANGDTGLRHDIYIYSIIDLDRWHQELPKAIRLLNESTADDLFVIHISTPGGCVFTTGGLVSAIRSAQGHVRTIAEGPVASAGVLVWAEGRERVISPGSYFMEHMSSQSISGNTQTLSSRLSFSSRYFALQLARLIQIGLFSQEEVDDMMYKEADIFITSTDAISRVGAISHD